MAFSNASGVGHLGTGNGASAMTDHPHNSQAAAIRQARNAIRLIINGVLRDYDAETLQEDIQDSENSFVTMLFDNLHDELADWEITGTWFHRAEELIEELRAEFLGTAEGNKVAELLVKYDLLP